MREKNRRLELLAPAGEWESLQAAVENGADAVYLGGKAFSARAYAPNFSREEIAAAVDYAHLRGVKIYVTINTLLRNEEMLEALEYAHFLYSCGVDAVIVQDVGFLLALRRALPQLRVHASTQMTIHNLAGVKFLAEQGVARIVLARELSLADLQKIAAASPCEIEVFAHGALCICYSGQCLFSSLVGGRSGNRGRCAQPCRMSYKLIRCFESAAGRVEEVQGEGYLLSPRDLNTLSFIPQLAAAGVAALKIEGRMKRPEYVATVVRIYRQALDRFYLDPENFCVYPEEEEELEQIFNRGFTSGYLQGNPGQDLMSYQRPNNRGVFIGRVVECSRQGIAVLLEKELQVGDGIEVWVTRGGRQGMTVREMEVNGAQVLRAAAGERVYLPFTGRARVGDRVFKTHAAALIKKAQESYKGYPRRLPIGMKAVARAGNPLELTAWDEDGNQVRIRSEFVVEKALKHPLDEYTLRSHLQRLGNTPFLLADLETDLEDGVMVPLSVLNQARREVIELLTRVRLENARGSREVPTVEKVRARAAAAIEEVRGQLAAGGGTERREERLVPLLSVATGNWEAALAAVEAGAEQVYLPEITASAIKEWESETASRCRKEAAYRGACLIATLPRIWQERERERLERVVKILGSEFLSNPFGGVLVSGPGGLQLLRENNIRAPIFADYTWNLFNNWSFAALFAAGVEQATLSLELNLSQIKSFAPWILERGELVVYGYLPVMVSEHCLVGAVAGGRSLSSACHAPCREGSYFLRDRLGVDFPLRMDTNCRMYVYNSRVLEVAEHLETLAATGVRSLRLEMRPASALEVERAVRFFSFLRDRLTACRQKGVSFALDAAAKETIKSLAAQETTRGHFFRGVE